MKKSKIIGVKTRMPSPYDITAQKTERTAVAILMHWMRDIIEKKNLDLGLPDVDTTGADQRSPDMIIYESRRSQDILCVMEVKPPYFDVFDEKELKKPAWEKANQRKAKYFVTCNFKELIWFNTERVNSLKPEEEQVVEKYHLSELEDLNLIEETRYRENIIKGLESFLNKLYLVHTGKEAEPKQPIDEWLIYRLQDKIRKLAIYYRKIIEDKCHKDVEFSQKLKEWFMEQGWIFVGQPQDFDKVARQTAYLLVNKILFYDSLQAKRPNELAPLKIPEGLVKGSQLQKILQSFFDEVLKIDYETIYTTDFIDTIAFPDSKEIIKEIESLIDILKKYDFSKIGYDIIGRIFERLIPQDERHNLGQYFTNPDVVDLILKFCLLHEDDKILDPSCGAGTFLVRSYQHKKIMNQHKKHEEILETLWGNDIAKFPAHLATINLAINDLSVDKNYPNILQEDFFALRVGNQGFDLPSNYRKRLTVGLGKNQREVTYPRWFDVVVGNPPYTRQEEIPEIGLDKEKLIESALQDPAGRKIAEISKRAGIHAYFFVHGTKFLREGGRFGFIVSNSWLDVDYGKGLQEFFLKNYKIITIIESKVERWFEEADVNTCIIILQKCKDEKLREKNLVRFVYLKKPLRYFIPPAKDMWEKQVNRLNAVDNLRKTILAHANFYENEDLRIFPKSQKELWDEGFDPKEQKYIGSKWGKYLRAPEIFFKILEKGKGKLVPLEEVAKVIGGIITGNNTFFYFRGERTKELEEKFLQPIIKSPRELTKIIFTKSDLKYKILMCNKPKDKLKGTKILKHIQKAEERKIHEAKTFRNREIWYSLPDKRAPILWVDLRWEKHLCHLNKDNVLFEHLFYGLEPKNKSYTFPVCSYFNSTISWLFIEIMGRTALGQGAIRLVGIDLKRFPCIDFSSIPYKFHKRLQTSLESIGKRKIQTVFQELGASSPQEVSLDKVKPDRRELDKIIMSEILGLTDEEQLEVYRAVVDLVKSRIEKAKSLGKKKKTKEGIDIDLLVKTITDKIGEETLGKFYRDKILTQKLLYTKKLPEKAEPIRIEKELFGWRLYSGKKYIKCASEIEARYLKIWLECGLERIKIPKNKKYLKTILPDLEKLKTKIDKVVESYLESITNPNTRDKISLQLWQRITNNNIINHNLD